jgi:predicted DNA-binding transcriptional regulator AlpA
MSNNGVITEKLLTAQAIAEKLSLSKRAVFRMKSAALICPCIKVGRGAVRWRQSDIEKWIALGCPTLQEFKVRMGADK